MNFSFSLWYKLNVLKWEILEIFVRKKNPNLYLTLNALFQFILCLKRAFFTPHSLKVRFLLIGCPSSGFHKENPVLVSPAFSSEVTISLHGQFMLSWHKLGVTVEKIETYSDYWSYQPAFTYCPAPWLKLAVSAGWFVYAESEHNKCSRF